MSDLSLREVLSGWTGVASMPFALQKPRHIEQAAKTVSKVLGGGMLRAPTEYDLKSLYHRIDHSWQNYRDLIKTKGSMQEPLDYPSFLAQYLSDSPFSVGRDLRSVPWILFYLPSDEKKEEKEASDYWLGSDLLFMKNYGKWLFQAKNSRAIRVLMSEFLHKYPTDIPTFEYLRTLLKSLILEAEVGSLQKWKVRCDRFGYLDSGRSCSLLHHVLTCEEDVEEMLEDAGMEGRLLYGRFFESEVCAALKHTEGLLWEKKVTTAYLDRLFWTLEDEQRLRFDDLRMRNIVAENLLFPFAEVDPSAEIKERLEQFFFQHYGDPRLPSGKSGWAGIPKELRQVVLRWQTKETLEMFFKILEETAYDRHWSYRKTFWTAYFNHHLIHEAWFVLGRDAEYVLHSIEGVEKASYGTLKRGQPGQSVLLMRMHGLTVAEWSHNGSCRFWLDGGEYAPKLYEAANPYFAHDLRNMSDFEQAHGGSEYGTWQDGIASWLEANIGVEVPRDEYLGRETVQRRGEGIDQRLDMGELLKRFGWDSHGPEGEKEKQEKKNGKRKKKKMEKKRKKWAVEADRRMERKKEADREHALLYRELIEEEAREAYEAFGRFLYKS